MKNKVSSVLPRVNFFDGQLVTEADFDSEQLHNKSVITGIINDFHGSGIVKNDVFNSSILLDTSIPGYYSKDDSEGSKDLIEGGSYDGKPVLLDVQPSDIEYGNRLVVTPNNVEMMGRDELLVLLIGYIFNSIDDQGQLVYEVLRFKSNKPKLTRYYYKNVKAVIFNNFSGGTGRNEYGENNVSLNLSQNGKIIISEADSFQVFSKTESYEQNLSPSNDLLNFITYSNFVNIEDLFKEALGDDSNFNDIYFELGSFKISKFEKNGSVSTSFGQKFLAKSTTIQKIELLMSVDADTSLPIDSQFDFSGELVLSIYSLSTEARYASDVVPDDLIDFDPDLEAIMEISLSQDDLESSGIVLTDKPSVVNFDFSSTLLADPSLSPSLEVGKFYSFVLSRRGNTSKGTVNLFVGYDEASRRSENGQPKNPEQEFGRQTSRYIEYDSVTRKWVDYSSASLWHIIHSETLEVTVGSAYSDDGFLITIPKYDEYIGDSKISNYIRDIPLSKIGSDLKNYVVLQHVEKFLSPSTHPRTGNFVFTRILDTGIISVLNEDDFNSVSLDSSPILISSVVDRNVRSAEAISGSLNRPGLIDRDYVLVISEDESIFNENLINRLFIPDTECSCGARYRIVKTECVSYKLADLNNDGKINNSDIDLFLEYAGKTINSRETETKILSGELSYIKFKQSDLNGDNTVDSIDLEYLELAIDGNISFTEEKEFRVLKVFLENIREDSNNPLIFEDTSLSGETLDSTNIISFMVDDYRKGLVIRVGDIISVSDTSVGEGLYTIVSKEFDESTLTVTTSVVNSFGTNPVFSAVTLFNVSVFSGTKTNAIADNLTLSTLPFAQKNWKIESVESTFSGDFFEVCDLRRFVQKSFIEESVKSCLCETSICTQPDLCGPTYKNQSFVPGDLYVPNGDILSAPGVPHRGDFEYVTITMPLPPGSIDDCQVDLYNTFIKSSGNSCNTSAGYPAMKYSDGTYVGCQDDGISTDITKGRVKFSSSIASLHVDGLVDGYAVDGYADSTSTSSSKDIIYETYTDNSYDSFETWVVDSGSSSIVTVSNPSGANEPAVFSLTSETSPVVRYRMLNGPSEISSLDGDLLIDFAAFRGEWSTTFPQGNISSYFQVIVTNADLSTTKLRLGWRQSGTSPVVLFWSGEYRDPSSSLYYSFDSTATLPDSVGDEILFRIRRVDDAFFAYYINPDKILDGTTPDSFGQYVRIGGNPGVQPGSGSASVSIALEQSDNPETGLEYSVSFSDMQIKSDYISVKKIDDISLFRDSSTGETGSISLNFPIMITRRTDVVSAKMIITAADNISTADTFNIRPFAVINSPNLTTNYNYPLNTDTSYTVSFSPGTVLSGDTFEVDITDITRAFISEPGFLPGTYKSISLEPDITANSSMLISPSISFEISYRDISTGVIFKVGISIDTSTGIASFKTKNILYDSTYSQNRTTIKFGVYLKKSGFINQDVNISISDLKRIGLGTCNDEDNIIDASSECYFIVGSTEVGTFVEGPFQCI